jgi:hypothetical protein
LEVVNLNLVMAMVTAEVNQMVTAVVNHFGLRRLGLKFELAVLSCLSSIDSHARRDGYVEFVSLWSGCLDLTALDSTKPYSELTIRFNLHFHFHQDSN